jgi:hypothetical protein
VKAWHLIPTPSGWQRVFIELPTMRTVVGMLVGAALASGCHFSSPVFTPKPGDYPCHKQDGSADPDAVSCRPYDGTRTCCPSRNTCVPDGCEYQGPEVGPGGLFEKRAIVARRLEQP